MRMCMPRAHIATCLQGVDSLFVVQTPDIFPNFMEDMPPLDPITPPPNEEFIDLEPEVVVPPDSVVQAYLMPESPASTVGAADSLLFVEDYVPQEEPER